MLDRMTLEQWDEWEARDQIEPVGHSSRMLGYIAFMLMNFFHDDVDTATLIATCAPWQRFEVEQPGCTGRREDVERMWEGLI